MSNNKTTEVIGIASGKGGVGKTTVSINLAVALAQRGHDVMLFDADLGLANAQIALGARAEYNLSHFLAGQKTLEEITLKTRQGIQLIPGASGMQELAALSSMQAATIVQAFSGMAGDVDYLIVDIAAGKAADGVGGNCVLTEAGKTVVKHGVTLVGETNLPALVAADSSALYARNVLDFLKLIINKEGALHIDMEDDIVAACLMTRDGAVVKK